MKKLILICLALSGCVSRATYRKDMVDVVSSFESQMNIDRAIKKQFMDHEKRIEALEEFMEAAKSRESQSNRYFSIDPGIAPSPGEFKFFPPPTGEVPAESK